MQRKRFASTPLSFISSTACDVESKVREAEVNRGAITLQALQALESREHSVTR